MTFHTGMIRTAITIGIALALLMAAPARVTAVEAATISTGGRSTVDDDAAVVLGFDTGLRAEVTASWRAPAPAWDAQAASATGAVRLELVPEPSVEVSGVGLRIPPAPPEVAAPQLHHLGYVAQLDADLERIRLTLPGLFELAIIGHDGLDPASASRGQHHDFVTTAHHA